MAQYCDSKILEKNWLYWILSSAVPDLEPYRAKSLLWTKIIGAVKDSNGYDMVKDGATLPDPAYPVRSHCIVARFDNDYTTIKFDSSSGVVPQLASCGEDSNQVLIPLPGAESESLLSIDRQSLKYTQTIDRLLSDGYMLEPPMNTSWHLMLHDINNICVGIANKFNQPSEEDRNELANEALYQVIRKLSRGRLVYTPGKAPVFNLLTTTIHRCMYSILNKRTNQKNGMNKLCEALKAGSVPTNQRSFKIHTQSLSLIRPK